MSLQVDRWYGTTIPEHGPSPQHPLHPLYQRGLREISGTVQVALPDSLVTNINRLEASFDRLTRLVERFQYLKRQEELHTQVMRQCAGIRRRQQRRSK